MNRTSLGSALICALMVVGAGCGDDTSGGGAGAGGAGGENEGAAGGGGADASGGSGGAPGCGGTSFLAGEACEACVETSCCDALASCGDEPECEELAVCVHGCDGSDHACIQECASGFAPPPTSTAWLALRECVADNCQEACAYDELVCGASAAADATCDACTFESCCDETAARNAEPDAFALGICVLGCYDSPKQTFHDCAAQCLEEHPAGVIVTDAATACNGNECWDSCGGSCAGPAMISAGACDSCMSEHCCDQGLACGTSSECALVTKNCIMECTGGNRECILDCLSDTPEVTGEAGSFFVCASSSCNAECFPNLPIECGNTALANEIGCKACLDEGCCDLGVACGLDANCFDLGFCIALCDDAACAGDCKAEYPSAQAAYADLDTCRTTTCEQACGGF